MNVETMAGLVIARLYALDTIARCPVLLVGSEERRGAVLARAADMLGTRVVPLGPALAQALLSPDHDGSSIPTIISRRGTSGRPLLIDRIEILFEPTLRIGAVDCLIQVARRVQLCAAWPGRLAEGRLR